MALPIVAGAAGGATDAVVHGETGLLVDPEDHVAVADALVTLLRDRELSDRLGGQGRARAAEFSWEKAERAGRSRAAATDRMNVLCVNHTGEVSGAERSLLDLMSGLTDDVSVRLACPVRAAFGRRSPRARDPGRSDSSNRGQPEVARRAHAPGSIANDIGSREHPPSCAAACMPISCTRTRFGQDCSACPVPG